MKDEPGVGADAYFAVRPPTSRIYATNRIEYVDSAKGKAPDALMDQLRAAAEKALSRL